MAVSPILEIEEVAPTQTDKTTTMNDMIVAIEAAANSPLIVNMSGGSVALSFTEFSRNQIFNCTSLSTAGTLTIPQVTPTGLLPAYRLFAVRNLGTGTLTVGGTAGATVSLAPSTAAMIESDGTNCVTYSTGGPGPEGDTGGAISITYNFNTATADADPGAGAIALNDATQDAATAIYIEDVDSNGTTWSAVLATLTASTNANKGQIRLFNVADPGKWALFDLTAVAANTGYQALTVSVVGTSSTNPFSSGDLLCFAFTRTGDQGGVGSVTGSGAVVATPTVGAVVVSLGTVGAGDVLANPTSGAAAPAGTSLSALLDFNFGSIVGSVPQRSAGGWAASPTLTSVTLAAITTNLGTISGGTIAAATVNGGTLDGSIVNAGIITGGSITGLPTPSAATDAVTKAYADALIQGASFKPTATVATAAALPTNTYANGTAGVGATITINTTGTLTIDGHVTALGDLVLVLDETTAANNGLYTVTTAGAVGVAAVLTRSVDMNTAAECPGAVVPVGNAGAVNANSLWLCNPSGAVTIGTTALPFTQLNVATALTASGGAHISGTTLTVDWNGGTVTALNATDLAAITGTLQLATRTAQSLMGNPGGAAARPSDIIVGSGLTLLAGGTLEATGGASGWTAASVSSISANLTIASSTLDLAASPTITGTLTAVRVTGLSTPSGSSDATTKGYVDAAITGLQIKPTATVATTAALPANTYSNGTAGVGATIAITATGTLTIDGHVTALGDLVLVLDETTAANNGLYTVTTAGAVGVAAVLTRSVDMNTSTAFSGALVPVGSAGTANANSLWLCNPGGTVTVGTTAIPFAELNKAADLATSGAGVSISGNQISVEWNGGTVTALTPTDLAINTGSLQFGTRGIVSLMGNPTTSPARPSDIAIGTGLSLTTGGTLLLGTLAAHSFLANATGSGTAPTGVPWGPEFGVTSGTIHIDGAGTLSLGSTATITPTNGQELWVLQVGTTACTITMGTGLYDGQRQRLRFVMGTTAEVPSFDSTVIAGTSVTGYTPSATADATDIVLLEWNAAKSKWMLTAVSPGY